MVEQADLQQILRHRTGLYIVIVGFRYSSQEIDGIRIAQIIVQFGENVTFRLQNLFLRETVIGHMLKVMDVGRQDFFVLGRDEHGRDTYQLQSIQLHNLGGQKAIDDVHGQKDGLGNQVETGVNLNQPVHQHTT